MIKRITGYDIEPGDPVLVHGHIEAVYWGYRSEEDCFITVNGEVNTTRYENLTPIKDKRD